jgi:polyphosphate kinase
VEVLYPVLDADVRERIIHSILEPQLRDTVNAWDEQPDGSYVRVQPREGEKPFDSQAWSINNGT